MRALEFITKRCEERSQSTATSLSRSKPGKYSVYLFGTVYVGMVRVDSGCQRISQLPRINEEGYYVGKTGLSPITDMTRGLFGTFIVGEKRRKIDEMMIVSLIDV